MDAIGTLNWSFNADNGGYLSGQFSATVKVTIHADAPGDTSANSYIRFELSNFRSPSIQASDTGGGFINVFGLFWNLGSHAYQNMTYRGIPDPDPQVVYDEYLDVVAGWAGAGNRDNLFAGNMLWNYWRRDSDGSNHTHTGPTSFQRRLVASDWNGDQFNKNIATLGIAVRYLNQDSGYPMIYSSGSAGMSLANFDWSYVPWAVRLSDKWNSCDNRKSLHVRRNGKWELVTNEQFNSSASHAFNKNSNGWGVAPLINK